MAETGTGGIPEGCNLLVIDRHLEKGEQAPDLGLGVREIGFVVGHDPVVRGGGVEEPAVGNLPERQPERERKAVPFAKGERDLQWVANDDDDLEGRR